MDADQDITRLLARWQGGDEEALREVLPLLYPQLKRIAESHFGDERPGHTLQATGLVHELYLKLLPHQQSRFASRAHFLAFAARLMRQILVDHARHRGRQRRGGDRVRIPLHEEIPWIDASSSELLEVEEALQELAALDERKARLLDLHCFLGASAEETAEALGVSRATFFRDLQFARAWLHWRLYGRSQEVP